MYGGERFTVPLGKNALAAARRAPIMAAVRAKLLSVADGAQLCGMRRDYFSRIINTTDGGVGVRPIELPIVRSGDVLRDAADVAVAALEEAGASASIIEAARKGIARVGIVAADMREQADAGVVSVK